MSSASAPDVLARFYAAETIYMATGGPKGGDFSAMAATLSQTIKLTQSPDLPYGGVYTGHSGFQRWAEEMGSYFEELEVQDPVIFESKDDPSSVIVRSTLMVKARGTGETCSNPFMQLVTVRDGVISEIQPFYWNVKGWNEIIQRGEDALRKL